MYWFFPLFNSLMNKEAVVLKMVLLGEKGHHPQSILNHSSLLSVFSEVNRLITTEADFQKVEFCWLLLKLEQRRAICIYQYSSSANSTAKLMVLFCLCPTPFAPSYILWQHTTLLLLLCGYSHTWYLLWAYKNYPPSGAAPRNVSLAISALGERSLHHNSQCHAQL